MRIFHVISNLGNGGAEKFVVELSNELNKNNEVTLICFKNIEDWMFPPKKINDRINFIQLGKKEGFDFSVIIKLLKIFINLKPDIVNCHLDSTVRYIYLISILYNKATYVQTIHSNLNDDKIKFFNMLRIVPLFKKTFTNICISHSLYSEFVRKYPKLKFVHINNGLKKMEATIQYNAAKNEIAKMNRDNGTVFVAVGRFNHEKNFSMLVHLFKRLEENNHNVILLIIGGEDTEYLEEIYILNKVKSSNTYLLGSKSNVVDYLLNADALIMSSRFEGMPIIILEAMSLGLPIVSTPAGGIVDLIRNGENGFIAKTIEEDDLYSAAKEFLNADHDTISKIKQNNIEYFNANLSIKTCAENYENLYQKVLRKR